MIHLKKLKERWKKCKKYQVCGKVNKTKVFHKTYSSGIMIWINLSFNKVFDLIGLCHSGYKKFIKRIVNGNETRY